MHARTTQTVMRALTFIFLENRNMCVEKLRAKSYLIGATYKVHK